MIASKKFVWLWLDAMLGFWLVEANVPNLMQYDLLLLNNKQWAGVPHALSYHLK